MTGIWSDIICSFKFLPNLQISLLIIQSINESLPQLISIPESPLFALTNDIKMNKIKSLYDNNFYDS